MFSIYHFYCGKKTKNTWWKEKVCEYCISKSFDKFLHWESQITMFGYGWSHLKYGPHSRTILKKKLYGISKYIKEPSSCLKMHIFPVFNVYLSNKEEKENSSFCWLLFSSEQDKKIHAIMKPSGSSELVRVQGS